MGTKRPRPGAPVAGPNAPSARVSNDTKHVSLPLPTPAPQVHSFHLTVYDCPQHLTSADVLNLPELHQEVNKLARTNGYCLLQMQHGKFDVSATANRNADFLNGGRILLGTTVVAITPAKSLYRVERIVDVNVVYKDRDYTGPPPAAALLHPWSVMDGTLWDMDGFAHQHRYGFTRKTQNLQCLHQFVFTSKQPLSPTPETMATFTLPQSLAGVQTFHEPAFQVYARHSNRLVRASDAPITETETLAVWARLGPLVPQQPAATAADPTQHTWAHQLGSRQPSTGRTGTQQKRQGQPVRQPQNARKHQKARSSQQQRRLTHDSPATGTAASSRHHAPALSAPPSSQPESLDASTPPNLKRKCGAPAAASDNGALHGVGPSPDAFNDGSHPEGTPSEDDSETSLDDEPSSDEGSPSKGTSSPDDGTTSVDEPSSDEESSDGNPPVDETSSGEEASVPDTDFDMMAMDQQPFMQPTPQQ